jgi:hypothetical protein
MFRRIGIVFMERGIDILGYGDGTPVIKYPSAASLLVQMMGKVAETGANRVTTETLNVVRALTSNR